MCYTWAGKWQRSALCTSTIPSCIHGLLLSVTLMNKVMERINYMNTERRLNIEARATVTANCVDTSALEIPNWLGKLLR